MSSNNEMEEETVDYNIMESDVSPERTGDNTPSPQVGDDSPKHISEVEGSPDFQQTLQDDEEEKQYINEAEMEGDGMEEKEPDHDPCHSVGKVQLTIPNINQLKEQILSSPTYIRNLPWRVMAMPREVNQDGQRIRSLGVFVQCSPKSPESMSWNVTARARITLLNLSDPEQSYHREILHCFCARENDWGYSSFIAWKDILDKSKGYLIDEDTVYLEAEIEADAPHGIHWDSRKHTGYVGLKNQGATCYMNSLLQTLYCTNKLRMAVYLMPTENDDPVKSVPLALQRLFYELQHSDKPVGTKKLTKSFGWDTLDIFMQHDVQELSRVLLDNIESKMKGTVVEGTIPGLFEGKMESFIRCTQVDYESTRVETFFDIQLNIKSKKNVTESFRDYVEVETMNGENKYDAGDNGLQCPLYMRQLRGLNKRGLTLLDGVGTGGDIPKLPTAVETFLLKSNPEAKKGVVFLRFPPVLHLHLMRFQYDPITDSNIKLNDRYEFPEKLNLEEFLKEKEDTPATYTLHTVLVHSGDNYGGHYVAYLNPRGKTWLKFDDDVVSTCSRKDAIENNFGGSDDSLGIRNCSNAYMLVYVRDSCLDDILHDVTDKDISDALVKRFAEERRLELLRRKERNEAHLYLTVEVYLEDDFQSHQSPDLVDFDEVKSRAFKVLKTNSYTSFHNALSSTLGYPREGIRVWPFERRSNGTMRPSVLEHIDDPKKTVFQHADLKHPWRVFVETLSPEADKEALPSYDYQQHVLLFFKYYDPAIKSLLYMGHGIFPIAITFAEIFPLFCERAGLPLNTPLALFEEIKPNLVDRLDPNQPLCSDEEMRDGDILCYQRADLSLERYSLPTVTDYFKEMYNRFVVTFYDKNIPNDQGFMLTLNQRMNYSEMAKAAAQHLNTDPMLIQFFRPQLQYSDVAIRCASDGCLREIISGPKNRIDSPPILSYQRLTIPVNIFENKKLFRCIFVNSKLREEKEFTVYVDKSGTVEDLLSEAEKEISCSEDKTTNYLRLLEVMTNRIVDIHSLDKPVSELVVQKMYRVEEIGEDEVDILDNEALIPVAHFNKAAHNVFGVPFLLKITDGERLSSIKQKIQARLEIPDRDFEKWKFAIVQTIAPVQYFSEENDDPLRVSSFYINRSKGITFPRLGMPWLGLNHFNKNPKRTRYTFEKAIKIHN